MAGNLNRLKLTVRLQGAINNFEDDLAFLECLRRHLPEDDCADLTEEEHFVFVELKASMASNSSPKTRQFARQLVTMLPRPPGADKTSLKLNWVMAICGVVGVLVALGTIAVPVLSAPQPSSKTGSPLTTTTADSGKTSLANVTPAAPGTFDGNRRKENAPDGVPPLMRFIHPIQLGIVVAMAFVQRKWFQRAGKQFQSSMVIAAQTLVQFRRGWSAMWWAWALLYAWFTLSALVLGEGTPEKAVGDVINSATALAIWWCFLALDLPSVNIPGQEGRDAGFRKAVMVAAIVAACCALLACADRFRDLHHFGVATVGIFNGLGLACLAGRFTSHWMRLPRWQILFIYSYAMMQLIYPFFDVLGKELWEPAVYMAVLMMKLMLANTLRCAVNEGGLDNYLEAAQSGLLGFGNYPERISAATA